MTQSRPAILIVDRALIRTRERLGAWETFALWEQADPLAWAAGDEGRRVRAIVTLGGAKLDTRLVEALPHLGLIACLASGYEGADAEHARAHGVEVTHSASVNHADVADHAVALFLAAARRVPAGDRWVREGNWGRSPWPAMRSVRTLKVGVVGLGVIGRSIASRLEAFGPQIAWWGRHLQPDAPWPRMESLLDLAAWSDVLMVAARADDSNIGLIDRSVIEALGSEGLLVNIARGSIVDEDALIAALKDGRLGAAALDVFAAEPTPPARWAGLDNALLTPHSAGMTHTAVPEMVDLLLENIRLFFAGEPVATPVPRPKPLEDVSS